MNILKIAARTTAGISVIHLFTVMPSRPGADDNGSLTAITSPSVRSPQLVHPRVTGLLLSRTPSGPRGRHPEDQPPERHLLCHRRVRPTFIITIQYLMGGLCGVQPPQGLHPSIFPPSEPASRHFRPYSRAPSQPDVSRIVQIREHTLPPLVKICSGRTAPQHLAILIQIPPAISDNMSSSFRFSQSIDV